MLGKAARNFIGSSRQSLTQLARPVVAVQRASFFSFLKPKETVTQHITTADDPHPNENKELWYHNKHSLFHDHRTPSEEEIFRMRDEIAAQTTQSQIDDIIAVVQKLDVNDQNVLFCTLEAEKQLRLMLDENAPADKIQQQARIAHASVEVFKKCLPVPEEWKLFEMVRAKEDREAINDHAYIVYQLKQEYRQNHPHLPVFHHLWDTLEWTTTTPIEEHCFLEAPLVKFVMEVDEHAQRKLADRWNTLLTQYVVDLFQRHGEATPTEEQLQSVRDLVQLPAALGRYIGADSAQRKCTDEEAMAAIESYFSKRS